MKLLLLLLPACFFGATVFAQDIYFDWVKQLQRTTGAQEGYSIGVDNDKNVYVVGQFENGVDLDPSSAVYNVSAPGQDHFFVIKLDPTGNFIWGKDIGGTRHTQCMYFKVEPDGDLYLTGYFTGTTDFDPGPGTYNITTQPTTGVENLDMFTMKLDNDGNFKWAKTAGALGNEIGYCVTTDLNGNVYTTGSLNGTVDFDPGPGTATLGGTGNRNTFITKFDQDGNFIWAKQFAGNYSNYGMCIRTDAPGNIYLSGIFEGTTDFDPGASVHNLVSGFYSLTPYLVKLDANGALVWVKDNTGGAPFEVNANQQIITYDGQTTFTSILSMYDVNGDELWAKKIGGRPPSWPHGSSPITLDAAGNIYLTGQFNYTSDFDPGPGTYNMTANGGGYNCDAFVCRLDANANLIWAKQIGTFTEELPTTIAVDTSGNVYTIGVYNYNVDFDPGPPVYDMSSPFGTGVYILKWSNCKNVSYSTLNISACTQYTLNGTNYTQSGTYTQTLRNALGCDSIITLHLQLLNNLKAIAVTACDSYTWNNQVITASGTYTKKFISAAGCDSTVTMQLTINKTATTLLNATICNGTQYLGYSQPGIYVDRFVAASGCDSIRTLHLTVEAPKRTEITATICRGQSYEGFTTAGTYVNVLKSKSGCDSTRTLHLLVNSTYTFTVNKTICAGETYMGHSVAGVYTDRLQTVNGCDSIQTTQLTVTAMPAPYIGNDTTICVNDTLVLRSVNAAKYTWQDGTVSDHFTVKTAGLYKAVASNSCGTTTASVMVRSAVCVIYFPNAFSPNGDGKNDRFGILNGYNISNYHLKIFNRWGKVIFESNQPTLRWDGSYQGHILSSDVFVWQCSFQENKVTKNMNSTVVLIR